MGALKENIDAIINYIYLFEYIFYFNPRRKDMKIKQLVAATIVSVFTVGSFADTRPTDPIGGQPAADAKVSVKDLKYQVTYQRAFETVLWSMPAMSIYKFNQGDAALSTKPNTILAFSKGATPNAEILTANNVTPYIFSTTDLSNGPVVIEIPAATEKASLYGQVVDHWQITIADVGPSGIDKGKGAKLFITPPEYKGKVPAGYLEIKSPSYRLGLVFRSIAGKNATTEDAYEYAKTIKMYNFSDPKPTTFVDPVNMRLSTLALYDERWFEDLHAIFSVENARPSDTIMMGNLKFLGIEKGKPFNPDTMTKKAMKHAVVDAYQYMLDHLFEMADTSAKWWDDRHWFDALFHDEDKGFSWEKNNSINLDDRAARYFVGTYYPKKLPDNPGTMYVLAYADKDGKPLEAGKTYSITVPEKVPVKQFWSLTVYDVATMAFIYSDSMRTSRSSTQLDEMKKNSDGSVTLYFGPTAPKGLKSNWIPTSGKRPIPVMRMYGPTKEYMDKSWKLPDVELVK